MTIVVNGWDGANLTWGRRDGLQPWTEQQPAL